jgi:hypothetical protein
MDEVYNMIVAATAPRRKNVAVMKKVGMYNGMVSKKIGCYNSQNKKRLGMYN